MRISYCSSDLCSSDLIGEIGALLNVSWRRTDYNRPYLYAPVRRSTATAPFNLPGYASQNVAGGLNEYGYFERPQANAAIQWQATPELEIYFDRSEERSAGKESVSTCSSRW